MKSNQRLDIQGLRALAVLSVVIFHVSPNDLPGGYMGVDVFFTISGYLIMGQIWRSLSSGNFTFADFYARRFRRLLPAYVVVAVITSIAAYIMMLPGEYQAYIKSLIASNLYVSNFWFYGRSSYFDSALEFSPLLHTWSLSVEEQFYVAFPLLLYAIFRRIQSRKTVVFVLAFLGLSSLILSEFLLSFDQSMSFYSSPTRFWQFILGGILGVLGLRVQSAFLSQLFALIALIVIGSCLFLFDNSTPIPGLRAVPVALATALLIYAQPTNGVASHILNNRAATYVGEISYSLYLWHWPVVVVYQLAKINALSAFDKVLLVIVCLILADLTCRFVERPIRHANKDLPPRRVLTSSAAISVCIVILAAMSSIPQQKKFSAQQVAFETYLSYDNSHYRRGICFLTKRSNSFSQYDQDTCLEANASKKNILLIGDSHSAMWYGALREALKPNETLTQVSASGCRPVLPLTGSDRCKDLVEWAFMELIKDTDFEKVIIAGRWRMEEIERVTETIRYLQSQIAYVDIIGPIIEYNTDLPRLLAINEQKVNVTSQYSKLQEKRTLDERLSELVNNTSASYISILQEMCHSSSCIVTTKQGVPMQFDYGHLTFEGATLLVDRIYPNGLLHERLQPVQKQLK